MSLIKWLDDHFEEYAMVILLIAITVVMFLQVIMRYVFNNSLSWPEEFTRFCFVWSTLLSISYCIKKDITLKVDILLSHLPHKAQNTIIVIVEIIVGVFFAYLLVNAFSVAKVEYVGGSVSPAMELPNYVMYIFTIFCLALSTLRSIQSIIRAIKKFNVVRTNELRTEGR